MTETISSEINGAKGSVSRRFPYNRLQPEKFLPEGKEFRLKPHFSVPEVGPSILYRELTQKVSKLSSDQNEQNAL